MKVCTHDITLSPHYQSRYQFDHRNASLREWIVNELVMGKKLGFGNESVDGIYIDDW